MSDIQKLKKVIGSLEEQSSKVSEFNGVLSAVNSAKAEIYSATIAFDKLAQEQKKLVSESYTRFEEYGDKLVELEEKLSALESNQQQTLSKLSELKFLTPEQFSTEQDKILLKISELSFVTPEEFEQGIRNTEKFIAAKLTEDRSKVEGMITAQWHLIKSLQTFFVRGILGLAAGITYLVIY